jgi:hypothetical protein
MNMNKTIMVALLSGGVGVAATAQQQPATGAQRTQPQYQTQQQQHQGSDATLMQKIRLVDKDVIDNELTANRVIGEDVYGTDGEKIGKVHDLKFEGSNFAQLRQSYLGAKTNDKDLSRRTADSIERTGDRVADSVERAGERTADAVDPNHDRTDRAADRWEREADRAAERVDRATDELEQDQKWAADRERDSWAATDRMSAGGAQLYAVVQTGGVLGLGADYFVVPFDQLRYDAAEERFQLGITEEQLEQIRERPTSSPSDTSSVR